MSHDKHIPQTSIVSICVSTTPFAHAEGVYDSSEEQTE